LTNHEKIFCFIKEKPSLLSSKFKFTDIRNIANSINANISNEGKSVSAAGLEYATHRFLQTYCDSLSVEANRQDYFNTGDPRLYHDVRNVKNDWEFSLRAEFTNSNKDRRKSCKVIEESLELIFQGIENLREQYPGRKFTIDGRLVGDIGEVIAANEYEIILDEVSQPHYDATSCCSKKRRIQIKATFKDSLTFSITPDYYIGIKLYEDGCYEEIYNGPGQNIRDRFQTRKHIGEKLLSFPIGELKQLSLQISDDDRIPKRRI